MKMVVSDYDHTFYLNDNDIEMIKEFNGYCMKEAVTELKNCAKKEYNSVSLLIEDILK